MSQFPYLFDFEHHHCIKTFASSLHHLYLEDAFVLILCTYIYASKEETSLLGENLEDA